MARQRVKAVRTADAKALVLEKLAAGWKVADAMAAVDRSPETYRDWRKNDPSFSGATKTARASRTPDAERPAIPAFTEFAAKYLKQALPLHQLRAWDVIEGKEPRELEETMAYQAGEEAGRFMIMNFPPNHAKSSTWTVNYVTWRIVNDPNIRIAIVSKTLSLANKFMAAVKFQLTSEVFADFRAAFDPAGGWKDPNQPWREDMIYVRGRTSSEKDPTLQALGIGSQIYGTRADLIIVDDAEDLGNVGQYEKHSDWISREVLSRLEPDTGQFMIIGTRVAAMDIYRYLRDEARTMDGKPFYTYFSQPAILENAQSHYLEWRVLWPERMHPKAIAAQKGAYPDRRKFELIYQQNDVSDEATFPVEAVQASINRQRLRGPMTAGATGHRAQGMQGAYVVAGLDPATVGATAAVVIATDKQTQHRWVMNCWNKRGATPREIIQLFKDWTTEYHVNEWRVERNAFQRFLTQLPELREWLTNRGVLLREHQTTGKNKYDEEFGVETLAPLFLSCTEMVGDRLIQRPDGSGQISLPSAREAKAVSELVEQLQVWEPEMARGTATDLVMSLWFAELGVRQYLLGARFETSHMQSRYTTRGGRRSQKTYDLNELMHIGGTAA
jgi:hypothetical protein